MQPKIEFEGYRPTIETERLFIRPVCEENRDFYKKIFSNPEIMNHYFGGPRDVSARFDGWLERWKIHPFSAMIALDKKDTTPIGHVVMGHGDYLEDEKGFSEIAVIIDSIHWNKGYGKEIVGASVLLAKKFKEKNILVPCDLTKNQEAVVAKEKVMRVANSTFVFLPFHELIATASKSNSASVKIFNSIFVDEHGGERKDDVQREDRYRYRVCL